MSVGCKLSADLLERLSGLSDGVVVDIAVRTLRTVREMTGDHVQHNVYFIDFPANVPDTFAFWMQCIVEALTEDASRARTVAQLRSGVVDLLTLPSYGNYRHTYAEMLAAHDELIAAAGDRMTVLHLGGPLDDEVTALYLALAGSTTPLGADDLADLRVLAGHCVHGPQPEAIPIRENRAGVHTVTLTVTDPSGQATEQSFLYVVSYDPNGPFATGGGSIVPGGSSSDGGDLLPGMDGTSKANFGFVVKYKNGSSTVPSGNMTFNYSVGDFQLSSAAFDYLVVTNQNLTKFTGMATVKDAPGLYPFKVKARDAGATGDRFAIKVWAPGDDPATDEAIYRASGDVQGQVTIHRK